MRRFPRGRSGGKSSTQKILSALPTAYYNSNYNTTLVDGAVSQWNDLANGNNATQGTAANRPTLSTINGNQALVFDGTNDSLATTLAVNPTGGMWGVAVAKSNILSATLAQVIMGAKVGDATDRLTFNINNNGSVFCRIHNGTANLIGRRAPANTMIANELAVLSYTYDGGTSASGIKIYKNGIRVDTTDSNAGSYTVPTAGASLRIGADQAGTNNGMIGYIADTAFGQGSQLADADRVRIENSLMAKFGITA